MFKTDSFAGKFIVVNKKEKLYWTGRFNQRTEQGFSTDINEAKIFSTSVAAKSAIDNNQPYDYGNGLVGRLAMGGAEVAPVKVSVEMV